MISEFYTECLAKKIINKEINPYTNNPFCLEDIKKEEYIEPVQKLINEMGVKKNEIKAANN